MKKPLVGTLFALVIALPAFAALEAGSTGPFIFGASDEFYANDFGEYFECMGTTYS